MLIPKTKPKQTNQQKKKKNGQRVKLVKLCRDMGQMRTQSEILLWSKRRRTMSYKQNITLTDFAKFCMLEHGHPHF